MTYLSDHLTVEEVNAASSWPMSNQAAANIPDLATQFEAIRAAGGSAPITLTSFYRSAVKNLIVGGASNSDHLTGEAWDGVPQGVDLETWARSVIGAINAGSTPAVGQLIIYPYSDGHVHVSFAGARGKLNEFYVEVAGSGPNRYAPWDGVSALPQWTGDTSSGAPADPGLPTDEGAADNTGRTLLFLFVAFLLLWGIFAADHSGD